MLNNTHNQWEIYAELYKAYLDDADDRVSFVQVFPRILNSFGEVRGKRILDLGCGQGRFSRAFHDLGAEVTAYDFSPGEIEIARSLDDGREISYSSDKESFENTNYYDLTLCSMVLLCNPPKKAFQLVQTIYNCLAQDGFACFVNTNTGKLGCRFKDFFSEPPAESKQGVPYKTIIPTSKGELVVTDYYYSPEHLKNLFFSAHFEMEHEEIISQQFVFHMLRKNG